MHVFGDPGVGHGCGAMVGCFGAGIWRGVAWDVEARGGGSVGRVCRQFCQLDDGVLTIEFKCDMVADA